MAVGYSFPARFWIPAYAGMTVIRALPPSLPRRREPRIARRTHTLAYQRIDGDTPFDYVGGDSILLANSMQYSDFNAPHERSWQVRYELDLAEWVPGLNLMAAYTRGSQIDGTQAPEGGAYNVFDEDDGEFEPLYGDDGKHWERNFAVNYVVPDGAAKGLSVSLLQSTHRANAAQGEGSQDELQLIVQYPLHIL